MAVAYFDQLRAQLDDAAMLTDVVSQGSDFIEFGGVKRHVIGYLGDFLFPPSAREPRSVPCQAESATGCSSRDSFPGPPTCWCWTSPPTISTSIRWNCWRICSQGYEGTVLLVSHDRAFLDNVATQVIAVEGNGSVREFVGGYDDWMRAREAARGAAPAPDAKHAPKTDPRVRERRQRLSFKEAKELETLPGRIETLEGEQRAIGERLADPQLYQDRAEEVAPMRERFDAIEGELMELLARWEALHALDAENR